jgi:hypothetical protein
MNRAVALRIYGARLGSELISWEQGYFPGTAPVFETFKMIFYCLNILLVTNPLLFSSRIMSRDLESDVMD